MSLSRLIFSVTTVLVFGACGNVTTKPPACLTDLDCSGGYVCFVDGCGDPTRGLAVEVRSCP
ncbi:MAG: hypothetical protein ABTQ32_40485 [Myxococcaceae bacterium]